MRSTLEGNPDYRDIATPWPPQEIAWRDTNPGAVQTEYRKAIQAQINNPDLLYVVRDVATAIRPANEQVSVGQMIDDLAVVDAQFKQLEALTHFRVPPVEWHVLKDLDGLTRVLARVGIVSGPEYSYFASLLSQAQPAGEPLRIRVLMSDDTSPSSIHSLALRPYREKASGPQLQDIDQWFQFQLGTLRDTSVGDGTEGVYLVDIEPRLGNALTSLALPDNARGERIT